MAAPNLDDLCLDLYAPLSYKNALGNAPDTLLAPTWVPRSQQRRLTAYKILAAYRDNSARFFRPDDNGPDLREYGDAALLVERTVAGVIGDDWAITVDGADDDLPDMPDLPDEPDDPGPDASTVAKRVFNLASKRWTERATAIVDTWEADVAAQPALQARQDWLRDWADADFLAGKITECEGDAVALGDGVYALSWSVERQRVVVNVYDPGFYFPVLTDDTEDGGYPEKVHVAWEYVDDDGAKFVRRLTWELVDLNTALFDPEAGDYPRDDNGAVMLAGTGDSIADGQIVRAMPWAGPDDAPSTQTCLYTDATWPVKDLNGRHVDDLDPGRATYAVTDDGRPANRLDLGFDFLPVVHVPNTPATRDHFGRSILLAVAQVLDDVHGSDTKREVARDLASNPVIALAGGTLAATAGPYATPGEIAARTELSGTFVGFDGQPGPPRPQPLAEIHAGSVFNMDAGGRMDVLDMTKGLAELRNEGEDLLNRLAVSARVPAEIIGRVKASKIASGVLLALSFGPFRQLVESLRLVREQKYMLVLKMVQRIAQAAGPTEGGLEPGPIPPARIRFGSYLPSDMSGVVADVVALLTQHGISRRTALRMLVDAGLDVDDIVGELDRIDADDTAAALAVSQATGSDELAARRLGLDLPEPPKPAPGAPPSPPVPTLPPVPEPPA